MNATKTCRELLTGHGFDRTALGLGLAALVVFGVGAVWGIPQATNPVQIRGWDVDGVAGIRVLSEFHNLLVDPKADWYTPYPLLQYLILGAVYAPYLLVLLLTGSFSSPSPEYPFGFEDPVGAVQVMAGLARIVTVLMAAGTVMGTYAVGQLLWSRRAGLIGATIFAVSSPMMFYSRTSNLDVPTLFWTVLGLVIVVRTLDTGLTVKRAALIGLFSALAVGTKDQTYGAWLPVIAFLLLHHWRETSNHPVVSSRRVLPPIAMTSVGLVVFGAANGIFIRPSRIVRHFEFITSYERSFPNLQQENTLTVLRPSSLEGYSALLGDLVRATSAGMTPILLLLGFAAAVVAWRTRPKARVLIWMVAGFVVLTVFPVHHVQYRYALLPILGLALLIGGLAVEASSMSGWVRLGLAGLLISGFGWQLAEASDLTYQMMSDARYEAGDWLEAELQAGDSIGFFGALHQLPHLPPGVEVVHIRGVLEEEMPPPVSWPSYVLVAPDYFSDPQRQRSTVLPEELYSQLLDGSLGYERWALFEPASLIGRPVPYLPYVNPRVQVFRREEMT